VPVLAYILTAVTSYLLGSIPTGYLVAAARGIDIRTVGSGNIGATNVFRFLGVPAGVFVLLVDALKGWVAVVVLARLFGNWFDSTASPAAREWLAMVGGVSAILGHNFTCWLRFKGGKGIATSAGMLIALVPWALLIIFGVWVIVFALTRYVSLASICASAALPPAAWATKESYTMICILSAMSVLAIYKHKANIQRLIAGTETRIAAKKASPQPEAPKQPS
jgi:glycerol-3-phosphate acyltransferase PlsY